MSLSLWFAVRWARKNRTFPASRVLLPTYSTWASLIAIYASLQIVASIETSLHILLPPPLHQLLVVLGSLSFDLGLLPVSCITRYSYYEELLFSTMVPMGLMLVFWGLSSLTVAAALFDKQTMAMTTTTTTTTTTATKTFPDEEEQEEEEEEEEEGSHPKMKTKTKKNSPPHQSFDESSFSVGFHQTAKRKRATIRALGRRGMILVVLCFYPTTSTVIIEIFRSCVHYQNAWSGGFMESDLSKRCGTSRHAAFSVYGVVMLVLIPIGIPLYLSALLFRHRFSIDPSVARSSSSSGCPPSPSPTTGVGLTFLGGRPKTTAIFKSSGSSSEIFKYRARNDDPVLRDLGIDMLFRQFRPRFLYAAPCELIRRVTMIAGVSFCGEAGGRAFYGSMLALAYLLFFPELRPFTDEATNFVAYACAWLVFVMFLCGFLVETRPFGYDNRVLGTVMLAFTLTFLAWTIYFGVAETNRLTENYLR
jgi:hypothetical protein